MNFTPSHAASSATSSSGRNVTNRSRQDKANNFSCNRRRGRFAGSGFMFFLGCARALAQRAIIIIDIIVVRQVLVKKAPAWLARSLSAPGVVPQGRSILHVVGITVS